MGLQENEVYLFDQDGTPMGDYAEVVATLNAEREALAAERQARADAEARAADAEARLRDLEAELRRLRGAS
jgi:hypothetical protein